MNVKVQCPCGKGVKVPESALGRPLKCLQCGVTNTYSAASVLKRYPDEPPPKAPPPARTPLKAAKTAKGVPKPAASGRAMDPKTKLLILGGSGGGVAALVLLVAILVSRSGPPPAPPKAPPPTAEIPKTAKAATPAASLTPAGKLKLSELLEQMRKSVVWIACERGELRSSGTGFVVRQDGIIATNYHVIREARRIKVGWENGVGYESLDAELLLSFPEDDIALLRVSRDRLPVATIARETPSRGSDVVALGFPLSDVFGQESMSVTRGIVTGAGHMAMDGKDYADIVRTDAQINPGNSGGPLVDTERGRVVGVVFAKAGALSAASGLGFAIPTSRMLALVPELTGDGLAFERRLEAERRVRADSPSWRKELERTRPYFNDLTSTSPEIRRAIPVDTLIRALQDADATVRSYAARALEERGSEAAAAKDALARTLLDSNPGVRVDAATALAAVSPKDPKVLEVLLEAFKSDNASRREAAAIALGRIGNRDARVLQALTEGLRGADKTAFQASLKALDALKPEGHRAALPVVIARLDKALAGSDSLTPLTLVDALAVCGTQSADQVGPILLRILKSRKSSLDQACARALTELGSAAVPYLTDLLADKDPALRAIGVATIGGLRPIENKVLGMVGTLTGDPSPLVRGAVLSALTGALRDGALVPLTQLLRFAEDPTGDIRAACAAALGTLPSLPPEGAKSLVRAMEDQDRTVRRTAIGCLRTHLEAASKVVPEIAAKLKDSDPQMKQMAIETLGDIGQPALDVLPQLVAIAKDPAEDPNIRHWAAESAVRIARFLPKER